jgi:uncharacterized protein (DUF2147 family)
MRNQGVALVVITLTMSGSAPAASPIGDWTTEDGSGIVRIGPCGLVQVEPPTTVGKPAPGKQTTAQSAPSATNDPAAPLCGLLAWSKVPAKGDPDYDPAMEGKSFIGTKLLSDMKPKGENRWEGEVSNPTNGKVYQSFMSLKTENVLRIEGCVLGFLCGGQNWARHTAPLPTSTSATPRR